MRSSLCFKIAFLAMAALTCSAPALAASSPPTVDDALDRIAQYAPQALQEQGAPGMIVAITDATHTLRIIPLGYANAASKAPVTEQTRFGIGSLSKSMTATALLELRDAGRFDPQRPVTAYLPWFSIHTRWRPITPHDLFTHTSGLPDGGLSTGLSAVYGLRSWMTGFAPGTHWSYSNVGYDTLGAILETLDHSNYPEIMQRRVFAPLGMTSTTAQWDPRNLENAAQGYLYRADDIAVPQDPQLMPAPTTHFVDPAGSVLSTGADMAAYMRYLIGAGKGPSGALISPQSYALLSSPGVTAGHELGAEGPGMYHRYGYGLAIMDVGGDKVLAHTGGVISYTACMMVDVTRRFGVIAISNLGYVGARPCAIVSYAIKALRAQAQGKALPALPAPTDPAHVAHAADYAATYTAPNGRAITVSALGDRLTLRDGTSEYALYPRGGDAFWAADAAFRRFGLQFGRDARQRIVELTSGPQWFTNERYAGPRRFSYPPAWSRYTGTYESIDANGYYWSMHVYELKGKLLADGSPLNSMQGTLFHMGAASWEPSWVRFEQPVAGKTQIAGMPGTMLYRTNPF